MHLEYSTLSSHYNSVTSYLCTPEYNTCTHVLSEELAVAVEFVVGHAVHDGHHALEPPHTLLLTAGRQHIRAHPGDHPHDLACTSQHGCQYSIQHTSHRKKLHVQVRTHWTKLHYGCQLLIHVAYGEHALLHLQYRKLA